MFRYVTLLYLRYFFIIILALVSLFAGLDYMQNTPQLDGFNLKVLYIFYKSLFALNLLFPIALVFAMIVSKIALIRSNALVSFYALGYSKRSVLFPYIVTSFVLTFIYISMHFTPFVNAESYAKDLARKKSDNSTKNIFVKYNDSFVYIKTLLPLTKKASTIKIYRLKDRKLIQIIYGDKAIFDGEKWRVENVKIINKPDPKSLSKEGITISYRPFVYTLEGFKPKVLSSVMEGKHYFTIQDAWSAWSILNLQSLETSKIRSVMYYMVIAPLFAPLLVILFFLFIPPQARNSNILGVSFSLSGLALMVWGVIYLFYRISLSGVIYPEFGIVPVVLILAVLAIWAFIKRTDVI
jgi:lipopolysaccharide export system permease protein